MAKKLITLDRLATFLDRVKGLIPTDVATTSANGLMSAADKVKLNNTNVAYGICKSKGSDDVKVVTLVDNTNWQLSLGAIIGVTFSGGSNTSKELYLNVNNTEDYPIAYGQTVFVPDDELFVGGVTNVISFYMFAGDCWAWMGQSMSSGGASYDTATSTTSGITKLYTTTGSNTDGTMTQAAITELVGDIESLLAAI